MSTPDSTFIRWRLIAAVAIAALAAGLVAYGFLTGAQWVQVIGTVWPR